MTAEIVTFDEGAQYAARVAAKVRGIAAERMVTGVRLAAALGISEMSMSRRMRGKLPFGIDELAVVAEVLEVDVAEFLPPRSGLGLPHLDSNQKPIDYQMGDVIYANFPERTWSRTAPELLDLDQLVVAA